MNNEELSRPEEKEKRGSKLKRKIEKIFLGEEGVLKFDFFLKRKLNKEGVSGEQAQQILDFARHIEETYFKITHEYNEELEKSEHVKTPYKISPQDLLLLVDLFGKIPDFDKSYDQIRNLINSTDEFSQLLEKLIIFSELPNFERVVSELNTIPFIGAQNVEWLKAREDIPGLSLTKIINLKHISYEQDPISELSLKSSEELDSIFSESKKQDLRNILTIIEGIVGRSRSTEKEFIVSQESVLGILEIISKNASKKLFFDYLKRSNLYTTNIEGLVSGFEYLINGLPEIIEMNEQGFDMVNWVDGILNNMRIADIVTRNGSITEWQAAAEKEMTGLKSLREVQGDELFCANAKVMKDAGWKVIPEYGESYINSRSVKKPIFYENRPTEQVAKIASFYASGHTKFGFHLDTKSNYHQALVFVFNNNFKKFIDLFQTFSPEELVARMEAVPDNFYQEITKSSSRQVDFDINFFLLEKVLGFENDNQCRKKLTEAINQQSLDCIHGQSWLDKYEGWLNSTSIPDKTIINLLESEDIGKQIQRLDAVASDQDKLYEFVGKLQSECNTVVKVGKIENLLKIAEYSDDKKTKLVSLLQSNRSQSANKLYITDSKFEYLDLVCSYSQDRINEVLELTNQLGEGSLNIHDLLDDSRGVSLEAISMFFDEIEHVSLGHKILQQLVPFPLSNRSLASVSQYNFIDYVKNLVVFGRNPQLVVVAKDINQELPFNLNLSSKDEANFLQIFQDAKGLTDVVQQLMKKSQYNYLLMSDAPSLKILHDDPMLLESVVSLSERAHYKFLAADAETLKQCLSPDSGLVGFVDDLLVIFPNMALFADDLKILASIKDRPSVVKLCTDFNWGERIFRSDELVLIEQIPKLIIDSGNVDTAVLMTLLKHGDRVPMKNYVDSALMDALSKEEHTMVSLLLKIDPRDDSDMWNFLLDNKKQIVDLVDANMRIGEGFFDLFMSTSYSEGNYAHNKLEIFLEEANMVPGYVQYLDAIRPTLKTSIIEAESCSFDDHYKDIFKIFSEEINDSQRESKLAEY